MATTRAATSRMSWRTAPRRPSPQAAVQASSGHLVSWHILLHCVTGRGTAVADWRTRARRSTLRRGSPVLVHPVHDFLHPLRTGDVVRRLVHDPALVSRW